MNDISGTRIEPPAESFATLGDARAGVMRFVHGHNLHYPVGEAGTVPGPKWHSETRLFSVLTAATRIECMCLKFEEMSYERREYL